MLTGAIANANSCQVDEGSAHSCMVLGADWGEVLYVLGVMGWFMLITLPIGAGAAIVCLLTLVIHRIAWVKRTKNDA